MGAGATAEVVADHPAPAATLHQLFDTGAAPERLTTSMPTAGSGFDSPYASSGEAGERNDIAVNLGAR
jgi:hypothetical protein